jgi:REP element-mobilizing transposase RayT
MNKYPERSSTRLKEYNYSQPGFYYVTICTDSRKCIFGDIIDGEMHLNNAGEMVAEILRTLPEYYPDITIDNYIVMPNHVHIIIQIVGAGSSRPNNAINNKNHDFDNGNDIINGRDNRAPTLGQIIAYFKYNSTKQINKFNNNGFNPIWQRNYHDHIIRKDKALHQIREYIINNPAAWDKDENNPDHNKAIQPQNSVGKSR